MLTADTPVILQRLADEQRLRQAWQRVCANGGGPGGDGQTLWDFAAREDEQLRMLQWDLQSGLYRPRRCACRVLHRPGKADRVLEIPSVRDRIIQTDWVGLVTGDCEPRFLDSSFAYRPRRDYRQAIARVDALLRQGLPWVVDADIRACFSSIPRRELLAAVESWFGPEATALVESWLGSADGRGIPQGAPVSPLIANVYLHSLDTALKSAGFEHVRYADDFVVACASRTRAAAALAACNEAAAALGLQLHPDKTVVRAPDESFRFLGNVFDRRAEIAPPAHGAPTGLRTDAERRAAAGQGPVVAPVPLNESKPSPPNSAVPPEGTMPVPRASAQTKVEREIRTLYLVEHGIAVKASSERLFVRRKDETLADVRIRDVDQVLVACNAYLSTAAIRLCVAHRVPILVAGAGGAEAVIDGIDPGPVDVLEAQLAAARRPETALAIARGLAIGKLHNARVVLNRYRRRHGKDGLDGHLAVLRQAGEQLQHVDAINVVRGNEGIAARSYFAALRQLLAPAWEFPGRSRPPTDPVNACLSYGYTLLFQNLLTLVRAAGLHPHVGFLHAGRPGHAALVSDVQEEFRAPVVDSLVLDLLLNGRMRPEDFSSDDAGACRMTNDARRRYVQAFEAELNAPVTPPGCSRRGNWRGVMAWRVATLKDVVLNGGDLPPCKIH